MDRRNFIGLSIAGVAGSIVAPKLVLAESACQAMAGGVFYTKDAPGRWSKKVDSHLPSIEIEKSGDSVSVSVITGHGMTGYEHYIVKHILLDQKYAYIDEHMFDPMKDQAAISNFSLPGYSGPLYALSVCNKHDTWLNMIEL